MSCSAPALLPRSPSLLLLGLLALLLWGQCGLLFQSSTAPTDRVLAGYAFSTDSLRTEAPAMLYITVMLRNDLPRPVILDTLAGALRFNGRDFSFLATAPLPSAPLTAGAQLRQHLVVPVPLPPDSLAFLRQKLQADRLTLSDPYLVWRVRYDTESPPHSRTLRVMQPYLPLLKPAKKAAGARKSNPAAPR